MYDSSERRPQDAKYESVWLATSATTDYAAIENDLRVDTAIVGGGIAGVTTAAKLRDSGQSVALLERDRILAGVTGHTTAKVTALHSQPYKHIESQFGRRDAQLYAEANKRALEEIASSVTERNTDCDFVRRPAYTYVRDSEQRQRLREEALAAQRAGLEASFGETTEPPFSVAGAITVENQASFHPRKYLLDLAQQIDGESSHIFEETTVTNVKEGTPCEVQTERGSIKATDVVIATQFPIVDSALYFARLRPKRSYVLAASLHTAPPAGMYYRRSEPYFSVRPFSEEQLALFGGKNHRTGQSATPERYRALEREVRNRFDVDSVE